MKIARANGWRQNNDSPTTTYHLQEPSHSCPRPRAYLCFLIVRVFPVVYAVVGEDTPSPMPCPKSSHILKHILQTQQATGHRPYVVNKFKNHYGMKVIELSVTPPLDWYTIVHHFNETIWNISMLIAVETSHQFRVQEINTAILKHRHATRLGNWEVNFNTTPS